MLGMDWAFNILAEWVDPVMRKGSGQGEELGQTVYCLISPPNQGSSHFCVQGQMPNNSISLRLDDACGSHGKQGL